MFRNELLYPLDNVDLTPVGYQPASAEFNRLNTVMADMCAALSDSVKRVRDASS